MQKCRTIELSDYRAVGLSIYASDESTGNSITTDFHPGTVIIVNGVIVNVLSIKNATNCYMCKQISKEKQKPKYTGCIQETTLVCNYFKPSMFIRGLIAFEF